MGVFGRHKEPGDYKRSGRLIKGLQSNFSWVFWGLVFSLGAAVIFSCFYGDFRANAERNIKSPIENSDNISWLYRNCYLLYRDLYNAQNEAPVDYAELYFKLDGEYEWLYDRPRNDVLNEFMEKEAQYLGDNGTGMLTVDEYTCIMKQMDNLENMFMGLENDFSRLNANYDYLVEDLSTGKEITNMSVDDKNRSMSKNFFYLTFIFDAEGNVTIGDKICGQDTALIRKYANEAGRENILQKTGGEEMALLERYGTAEAPRSCRITFAVSNEGWEGNGAEEYGIIVGYGSANTYTILRDQYNSNRFSAYYVHGGVGEVLIAAIAAMALAGLFMPVFRKNRPWNEVRLCTLPLEVLCAAGLFLCRLNNTIMDMIVNMLSGNMPDSIRELLRISPGNAWFVAFCINLLGLSLYFFGWWYLGVCARALREYGIRGYIRKRSVIYRFFPFTKKKVLGIYHTITHMDLTRNANRSIIKIVLVNAAVLFIISCFWLGGVGLTVVYSIVLYFMLRKYISDLQNKYKVLLDATNEMAEGRLNISINEDLGVFEPFKPQVIKIQEGFRKAVDQEVKSQRMKAELITNVSHDLKTPLTAIITYISLLKEKNVTEEQRKEYLDTLERKSLRLKALIEDLFEVSKANSQNITLNLVDVDIMNLVKQVQFEMSDKLNEANLDIRMNLTDEKIILSLDSQKTYRIFENLFGNVAKYAMPGTRVYVNGFCVDERVLITIKNISAQEITVDSSELMERFVRGDASRNTEGSGLGLAIVKSFAQLQGGELSLEVDGDLFKATVSWTLPQ